MLLNPSALDSRQLQADICILGAGAAGITLAIELAKRRLNVLLIAGGGRKETRQDRSLNEGSSPPNASHEPLELNRCRALGGATQYWGGRLVPLEPIDFQRRPYMELSGWPIAYEAVARWYPRALELCETSPTFEVATITEGVRDIPPLLAGGAISTTTCERWSTPTDFGARYGPLLAADEHARVLLDYHATEIRVSEDQSRVERVRLQSRRGRSLDVSARVFILAAGGLENARLLLASQSLSGPGVGNCHGMVGRCYMSHLAGTLGRLELSQQEKPPFYRLAKDHSGAYWRRRFRLTDQAQRRGRTANIIGFPLRPPIDDPSHGDAVLSLLHLHERLWRRRDGEPASWRSLSRHLGNCVFAHPLAWSSAARQAWLRARQRRLPFVTPFDSRAQDSLFFQSEHAPNRESRVTLGDRRDEFGVPRLDARIRFSEIDYRTVSVFYQELDHGLRATRQGRVDYNPADLDRHLAELTSHFNSLAHQLGTTRMSARPQDGVVDADCRSHCLSNLYISGGSVFPTSGHANPTLTIVALALRLAEHVAGRLATPSVVVSHSLAPAPQVARAGI